MSIESFTGLIQQQTSQNTGNLFLISPSECQSNNFIFGVKIQDNTNFNQDHIYCLYLVLLKYGELQNQQSILEQIKEWKKQYDSILSHQQSDNKYKLLNKKNIINLQCMSFLEEELSQSIKLNSKQKQKYETNTILTGQNPQIHPISDRKLIQRALKIIVQRKISQQKKSQQDSESYLIDTPTFVNKFLNMKTEVKNYFQFSVIQFQQFKQKGMNVIIQINKKDKTVTYIKKNNRLGEDMKRKKITQKSSLNSNTSTSTKRKSKKKIQNLEINLYLSSGTSDQEQEQFGKYAVQKELDNEQYMKLIKKLSRQQSRNKDEQLSQLSPSLAQDPKFKIMSSFSSFSSFSSSSSNQKTQSNNMGTSSKYRKKRSYNHEEKEFIQVSVPRQVIFKKQQIEQNSQQDQDEKFIYLRQNYKNDSMTLTQYQNRERQIQS